MACRFAARGLVCVLLLLPAACGHKAKVSAPTVGKAPGPAPARPTPVPKSPSAAPAKSAEASKPPTESAPEPIPTVTPQAPASDAVQNIPSSPHIRIGINVNVGEVRISAPDEFYLSEKVPETAREIVHGEIQVRVERGDGASSEIFRIQVAALSKPAAAEELRRELSEKFAIPVIVHENTAARLYSIRLGAFDSREQAQKFAAGPLSEAGYRDSLIVRDTIRTTAGEPRLALRGPGNLFRVSRNGYLFSPSSTTDFLRVDGKPYRGLLDLILDKNGRLTVVNELETEEYLLGVVPAEMSPTAYPEFAALAAQSIAARTYALKNLGRHRTEGFDLTADVRNQVYSGVSAEKEISSDAVLKTYGLAIYFQNALIDAMYMSTCGGRTEDFAEVFDAQDVPYLKSVVCSIENHSDNALEDLKLQGNHDVSGVILSDDGGMANRSLELVRVLGLTEGIDLTTEYLEGSAKPEEIRSWVDHTRRLTRRPDRSRAADAGNIGSRAGFVRYMSESLIDAREIETRVSSPDADYYLKNLKDGNEVPQYSRRAFAYVMQLGILRAFPDNSIRPGEAIRRADALTFLSRWIESSQPDILTKGVFAGPTRAASRPTPSSTLAVKGGKSVKEFPLSSALRLFRIADGRSLPVDELKIIGNEKLKFHVGLNGQIDFLEVELNPTGAASDRYSPVATWETTITRKVIAEKLAPLIGNKGEIKDLKPARLGKSGRAVLMQIVGSRGSVLLNGLKFRNALGLRDTLFTISRNRDTEDGIESFTFHGRGWGHGVGLCQVGAYGMAKAGLSYESILKTYYQGIEIHKAY